MRFEPLEERRLLALTVTTNLDVVDFNDGVLSLREAIFVANTAAGPDEINFDFGHDGPETIVLTQGQLEISDALMISGPGRLLLTIDASGSDPTPDENNGDGSRVFLVDDGDDAHRFAAELRGLAITGGDTIDLRGGGIHSREDLTIVECSVYSNSVQAPVGETGGWGGGIQSLHGDLSLFDSVVGLNTATTAGGGIDFNPVNSDGELRIEDSAILFNHAGIRGGGLLVAGDATIVGTNFEDNEAGREGGGVAVYSLADEPVLHFSESTLLRNSAVWGGGIYSDSATARIELDWTGIGLNEAKDSGGGIWMRRTGEGSLAAEEYPLVMRNSFVSSNVGGGLVLAGHDATGRGMAALIEASRISYNESSEGAFDSGDGLTAFLERLTITGSWIEHNEGAGVRARGQTQLNPTLAIANTQLNENAAGLAVRDMATTLANTTITGNLGRGVDKRNGTLVMTGGTASGNLDAGLYSAIGSVSIADAVLSSNQGRGLDVRTGTLTVIGSRFEYNQSNQSGAGIYLQNGSLTVSNSTINHNTSGSSGGGIHHNGVTGQTVTITGSELSHNVAAGFGGGIDSSANLSLVDSKVIGNRANAVGGGIRAQRELSVIRSAVSENRTLSANAPGGGFSASGNVTIIDSSVSKNRTFGTLSPGGGAHSTSGVMNVVRSNISGNSTEGTNSRGGGISGSTVSIVDSSINGNFTTGSSALGGGIAGSTVSIAQSTISSNSTLGTSAHGAGAWAGARMTVRDSTVTRNEAEHILAMGGGLMVADGPLTLSNSIVAQNFASGGADSDLKVQATLTASYTLLGSTNTLNPPQATAFLSGPGNAPIADPKLSPLAYFGGPEYRDGTRLETHVPLADSPVINMGDPATRTTPVALYRFGEAPGATTVIDAVGNLDGTYSGGPSLGIDGAPATNGSAVDFDGLDDFATVPASFESDFTISLWVKTSQPSGVGRIGLVDGAVPQPNDFGLYIDSGRLLFLVSNIGIVANVTINDGTWHHVAVTRNSATGARNLYVDGVLRGSAVAGPTGAKGDADSWRIGGLQAGGGQFDGALDELAIYDRVLTATELLQQVSAGPGAFDQRGEPFDRIVGGRIDIGAVERQEVTFVVDTLADESDGNFAAGDLSLREAIELANANPGADAISFKASLTAAGPATILLTQGELPISDAVAINGPGASLLTIDARQQSRVAKIDDPFVTNEDFDVTISGLTFQNGRTTAHNASGTDRTHNGGAIHSATNGILSIQDSVLRENGTLGSRASGGAIFAIGSVAIGGSVVEGNTTLGERAYGGGIHAFGSVTIAGSVVRRNSTAGSVARGGGVRSNAGIVVEDSVVAENWTSGFSGDGGGLSGGLVTVTRSTVAGNRTTGGIAHGGGIYGLGVELVDSTLSGNTTAGDQAHGGGALSIAGGGITVIRSTVTDNHAQSGTSHGGGLRTIEGNLEIAGSIVAGNSAGGEGPDLRANGFADFVATYSLIGDTSGLTSEQLAAISAGIGNILNEDPQLGPLAYNGGPVLADGTRMLTHALLPGSPAIDAGDPSAVAGMNGVQEFDQRGGPWSRVVNGDDVPEARIDMGAVESQANPLPGDYNFNGIVDAADYSVWRDTVGSTNDLRADGSSAAMAGVPDGVVDAHDYAWWKANFGNVLEQGAGSTGRGVIAEQSSVVREPVAGERRLAGFGEGSGGDAADDSTAARELAIPSVASEPARRISAATSNSRALRAARIDAALLAWTARRGGTPGIDRECDLDLVGGNQAEADQSAFENVFAGLAHRGLYIP